MNATTLITRFMESRVGHLWWRYVFHLYERGRELRALYRARFLARNPQLADEGLKGRFCGNPFTHFEVYEAGSVHQCCALWLPLRAGNLHSQSPDEIWNSQHAQDVRASILDGSFRYCDHELCPDLKRGALPTRAEAAKDPFFKDIIENNKTEVKGRPRYFNFANDRSCNLSCPSCRTQRIQFSSGPAFEGRKRLQEKIEASFFTEPSDEPFVVSVTGSGDPFASRLFSDFLARLDGDNFPAMQVNLQTNGTMFTRKAWERLRKVHDRIGAVMVSFDAATEATYRITRRGGSWRQLLENMEFISGLRRDGWIKHLRADFVVQHANYREMPAFVELAQKFDVDGIVFSRASNWGTWTSAEYRKQCVWEPEHPEHPEFCRVVASRKLDHPRVSLGNLWVERQQALAEMQPASAWG
jgi:pyruvate-formate lyase-activating enzyme